MWGGGGGAAPSAALWVNTALRLFNDNSIFCPSRSLLSPWKRTQSCTQREESRTTWQNALVESDVNRSVRWICMQLHSILSRVKWILCLMNQVCESHWWWWRPGRAAVNIQALFTAFIPFNKLPASPTSHFTRSAQNDEAWRCLEETQEDHRLYLSVAPQDSLFFSMSR